jgi:hypothetical protein
MNNFADNNFLTVFFFDLTNMDKFLKIIFFLYPTQHLCWDYKLYKLFCRFKFIMKMVKHIYV